MPTLRVKIADAGPARLSVKDGTGRHYAPAEARRYRWGEIEYFYCHGEAAVTVPRARLTVTASRGCGGRLDTRVLSVTGGSRTVVLSPRPIWHEYPAAFRSLDPHVHGLNRKGPEFALPPNVAPLEIGGEGLDAVCFVDGFEGTHRSARGQLLHHGDEYRSNLLGHFLFLGLNREVSHDRENLWGQSVAPKCLTHFAAAREADALVIPAHPVCTDEFEEHSDWPGGGLNRALPVWVARGVVDAVMVHSQSDQGLDSLHQWYQLLNCGFRLPALAGSDAMLGDEQSPPVGVYRTWAELPPGSDFADWFAAIRAGDTFFGTGPRIRLEVDVVPPDVAFVTATVDWPHEILHLQLICDGELCAENSEEKLEVQLELPVGWLAARCFAAGPSPAPEGAYAHTNPLWLGEVPAVARRDAARGWLKQIDRLEALAERWSGPSDEAGRAELKAVLDEGRKAYRDLLD